MLLFLPLSNACELLQRRVTLQEQEYEALAKGRIPEEDMERPAIVICHSFPECWQLDQDVLRVGGGTPGCPCPQQQDKGGKVGSAGNAKYQRDR
jgi:hypothetical protein